MDFMLIGDSGVVVFKDNAVITGETKSRTNKATSNPIEGGSQINDHATKDARKHDIAGTCSDATMKPILEAMADNLDLVAYRGKEAIDDAIILNLNITHSPDNKYGFSFTASLQQMNVTAPAYAPINAPTMSTQDQAAKTSARTKKKTEQGLQTVSSSYGLSHVDQFNSPAVNSGITQARTNPGDPGFKR